MTRILNGMQNELPPKLRGNKRRLVRCIVATYKGANYLFLLKFICTYLVFVDNLVVKEKLS